MLAFCKASPHCTGPSLPQTATLLVLVAFPEQVVRDVHRVVQQRLLGGVEQHHLKVQLPVAGVLVDREGEPRGVDHEHRRLALLEAVVPLQGAAGREPIATDKSLKAAQNMPHKRHLVISSHFFC